MTLLVKVELVSYQYRKTEAKRLAYTAEIINRSSADIILFAGHTLLYSKSIAELSKLIRNKRSYAFIETRESDEEFNHPYLVAKGKIVDLKTHQFFVYSSEIKKDITLGLKYLDELETKRIVKIGSRHCLLVQCGEINILKNHQTEGNRASFRFDDDSEMRSRFEKILSSVDIVLNPMHSLMGNQGKLARRRELFSRDGRLYFSTCNADAKHKNLRAKSIQYAYQNGIPLCAEMTLAEDGGYISRVFTVDDVC